MPFDGTQKNSTALVLLKAAEIIREGGWCQMKSRLGSSHCVARAIFEASEKDPVRARAGHEAFAAHLHLSYVEIPFWNDSEYRTKDDVLRALEECAKNAAL